MGQLPNGRRIIAQHPRAVDVRERAPEGSERLRTCDAQGACAGLLRAVLDREEQRDHVDGMVGVEMGEKEPVHPEGIEAGPDHAAYRARAQIEDEHLPANLDHHATLAPLQARNHRAGPDGRDLHLGLPSVGRR